MPRFPLPSFKGPPGATRPSPLGFRNVQREPLTAVPAAGWCACHGAPSGPPGQTGPMGPTGPPGQGHSKPLVDLGRHIVTPEDDVQAKLDAMVAARSPASSEWVCLVLTPGAFHQDLHIRHERVIVEGIGTMSSFWYGTLHVTAGHVHINSVFIAERGGGTPRGEAHIVVRGPMHEAGLQLSQVQTDTHCTVLDVRRARVEIMLSFIETQGPVHNIRLADESLLVVSQSSLRGTPVVSARDSTVFLSRSAATGLIEQHSGLLFTHMTLLGNSTYDAPVIRLECGAKGRVHMCVAYTTHPFMVDMRPDLNCKDADNVPPRLQYSVLSAGLSEEGQTSSVRVVQPEYDHLTEPKPLFGGDVTLGRLGMAMVYDPVWEGIVTYYRPSFDKEILAIDRNI